GLHRVDDAIAKRGGGRLGLVALEVSLLAVGALALGRQLLVLALGRGALTVAVAVGLPLGLGRDALEPDAGLPLHLGPAGLPDAARGEQLVEHAGALAVVDVQL